MHSFNTYFFDSYSKKGYSDVVRRLTKHVDIFATSIVFIPVNIDMEHWILVAIEMELCKIVYYDGKYNEEEAKMVLQLVMGCIKNFNLYIQDVLDTVFSYLKDEHLAKKGYPLKQDKWMLKFAKERPRQYNNRDCGLFVCKFAEYLSRRAELTFCQENIFGFRQQMMAEILLNKLY